MFRVRPSHVLALACALPSCQGSRAVVGAQPQQDAQAQQPGSPQTPPPQASAPPSATDFVTSIPPPPSGRVTSEAYDPLGPHYRMRRYSVERGGGRIGGGVHEGIAHYESLLFEGTVLSDPVGRHWLSPDESYIVYESTRGQNVVHSAISKRTRLATPHPYAIPSSVRWDLPHGQVTLSFDPPTAPITVALP